MADHTGQLRLLHRLPSGAALATDAETRARRRVSWAVATCVAAYNPSITHHSTYSRGRQWPSSRLR
eukprot:scaffold70016_cov75-Phaeocystis_antarctica.AAC.1